MADDFASRLKALMRQKKCTLKQVGDATGKSISAAQKWTTGGDITYEALRRLADFLGVNWIWLRYGEEALASNEVEEADPSILSRLRRQFIAEIQQREAQLMLALNSARMATWQDDLITGAFTVINDEEVLGTKMAYFDDILRIILPEDQPRRNAAIERALQEVSLYECDYRIRRPDTGSVRWLRVRGKPLRDLSGRPVKMTGILYDITEMKEAELAREDALARFNQALDAADIFAWDWQADTQQFTYSSNIEAILGVPATAVATLDQFLERMETADAAAIRQIIRQSDDPDVYLEQPYRFNLPDGSQRWMKVRGRVWKDAAGGTTRMTGITRRLLPEETKN